MLEFHPAANIFPLMAGDDYAALVADIAEHGQREPIWLYDGMILDGRNRYRACTGLGLVCETREYTGDDPQAFVISLNLHRRHLTREQRDDLIRHLRGNGYKLQKIADAVGVSVGKVHNVVGDLIFNSEIENARGQLRPMQYAARAVEVIEDEPEPPDSHYTVMGEGGYEETLTVGSDEEIAVVKRPHVAQNSGNNEWYTPTEYIEAARAVMGRIDLDPASTEVANSVVGASKFYTKEDDGLLYDWHGKVWMNPPYAQPYINQFVNRLREEYEIGRTTEAIALVNNATETTWFHNLALSACAVCFPLARIRFWSPDRESSPLQGQAVIYLGSQPAKFIKEFERFGWCAEVVNDKV
jgi:ParB family chromosome partitioning protein